VIVSFSFLYFFLLLYFSLHFHDLIPFYFILPSPLILTGTFLFLDYYFLWTMPLPHLALLLDLDLAAFERFTHDPRRATTYF
jgi:hypothetical protein